MVYFQSTTRPRFKKLLRHRKKKLVHVLPAEDQVKQTKFFMMNFIESELFSRMLPQKKKKKNMLEGVADHGQNFHVENERALNGLGNIY